MSSGNAARMAIVRFVVIGLDIVPVERWLVEVDWRNNSAVAVVAAEEEVAAVVDIAVEVDQRSHVVDMDYRTTVLAQKSQQPQADSKPRLQAVESSPYV